MGIRFEKGDQEELDEWEPPFYGPSVVWSGHLYDYSGYAKANREFLWRVANSLRVRIHTTDLEPEPVMVDSYIRQRLDIYKKVAVYDGAPLLRFYTPKLERMPVKRVCFTMMETEGVHDNFIKLLNENYDEAWTPTKWNKGTFESSGLKIPCHVVPLGVDRNIYRTLSEISPRPSATLITTSGADSKEVPKGYGFITVFQPTFRKGSDVIVAAFERAFADVPEAASLVLVTSNHQKLRAYGCDPFAIVNTLPAKMRSRVYHLTGRFTEEGMAKLYNSFDCYVTASRGEGWNLPLTEAAACGLSVVASRCSSHTELFEGTEAELISPDGFGIVKKSETVSKWYENQPFAKYDGASIDAFAASMRKLALAPSKPTTTSIMNRVRSEFTWDRGTDIIVRRLLELQGEFR